MDWEYKQPVRIRFGEGMVRCLAEEIEKLGGENGVLVTSPSFVKRGITDKIINLSGGRLKHVFSSVSPNPDVKECDQCAALMHTSGCDFVVAMGGGSVMDCAKAAATFCLCPEGYSSTDFLGTSLTIPQRHLPLIVVPTTAGTASEVTCVSVLSDHDRGVKAPLVSDGFYPTLAIVDPELTYSVPPHLTACTGFDVLCHSVEAYWSRHHQPACDALAVHAARNVLTYLHRAVANGKDHEARSGMAEASVIAGLAFNLPKTTSSHACSYPLTNLLGISHGEACALTLTYFIRLNDELGSDRPYRMAQLLGYDSAEEMASHIDKLKAQTGMMSDLRSFNISKAQLEQLVKGSMHPNLKNNPVEITETMLRQMYEAMI